MYIHVYIHIHIYIYIYIYVYIRERERETDLSLSLYIYIYIERERDMTRSGTWRRASRTAPVELEFLSSSFSSSNFSIRAFRAYPLVEIRQTVPCRAIRGDGISVKSTLPPS